MSFLVAGLPLGAAAQDRDRALAGAYNASGQALFRQFSAAPGNIVFSPYSIGTAMAMALAGARGDTEREMARVLQQRLPRPEIDAATARALATLKDYDKSAVPPTCPAGMRLNDRRCESALLPGGGCLFPAERVGELCVAAPKAPPSASVLVANALMLTGQAEQFAGDYVALLKNTYAAEVFERARLDDVNGWVDRKTQGKIDRILDDLPADAAAVILNAVYFKARWAEVFSKNATRDDAFHVTASETIAVPTMRKLGRHAVVVRQGYRALRLPYEVGALGMVIVLPNATDGLAAVSARLDAQEMSALFDAVKSADRKFVDLSLPRFKTSFKAGLASLFRQSGMTLAFDLSKADFSGMTGRPPSQAPMAIGDIAHRAVIDVTEEGTEAAAATAAVMLASAPRTQEVFRVDRPFAYFIVDDATGAILFQGRLVDPR